MKKVSFLLAVLFLCLTACEQETLMTEDTQNNDNSTTADAVIAQAIAPGEVVIKYDESLTEAQKQSIRDSYGVQNYKNCTCADPTLELWIFELDSNGNIIGGGTIEGVVESSKDDSGVEGSEINPIIKQDGHKLSSPFGSEDITSGLSIRATQNSGVTIAILDTGIDYNYFGFDEPFLYNSELGNSCEENGMNDYLGWDFVDGDNNPFDWHGHGTQISSMIFDKLTAQNVDFQVLPVRVFDHNGDARYFDILCGFKYAINNQDVDLINMSFGWYQTEYQILGEFIHASNTDKVVVTSAGNLTNNNDLLPHYPSSYQGDHLLSIASWNGNMAQPHLSRFSNYGQSSVDIAALGEHIPFYLTPDDYVSLMGTSYSAATVTAFGASIYTEGMSPQEHIQFILSAANSNDNLQAIKYQSYIYY
ncbi:MAG: S8 family serine peptidase [Flavobacteriaceae bacterium]|nr:S8 family serine peptidase [Flavobacteriaceae bacterium]